jgi:hypothetical protein
VMIGLVDRPRSECTGRVRRLMSKSFWGVSVVLVVGLITALPMWSVDSGPTRLQAAASLNYSAVNINGLQCLSIDPHKVVFDQKDYSDPKLVETIVDILSIKTVLFNADYETCPWGFFVTIVPGQVSAVRFEGQSAENLVSIGICERTHTGTLSPSKCLNKNIYVFSSHVEPHELLSAALVGLARLQTKKWEMFQVERRQ